ncbi:hypothetical protein BH10BAC2_BH10BAC2_06390 [soil metagenome]
MKTLEEIMAEATPKKLQEVEKIRNQIDWKFARQIPLSEHEEQIHCEERTWVYKSHLPECENEFFREFFLKNDPLHPTYYEIFADNHIRYGAILLLWDTLMKMGNISDPIIKAERIEFKYELWQLRKQIQPGTRQFNAAYLNLLEWSKFRSIAVRRIFKRVIHSDYVTFLLNNKTIIYNYTSLNHIMARHYAHGVKPYNSGRDHFYGVFAPEDLHIQIGNILRDIDNSKLYINDSIEEVSFRYRNDIFKINTKVETYFEAGKKGMQKRTHLTTFYKLGKKEEIQKLTNDCYEKKVSKDLTIFIKK